MNIRLLIIMHPLYCDRQLTPKFDLWAKNNLCVGMFPNEDFEIVSICPSVCLSVS